MAPSREAAAFRPILKRFGVPSDGVLIVHSAIATLSRGGYRAEAIIDELIEHMRDGNLFMPTMTWRTVTLENPDWDELKTPSHTGVLSEIFRRSTRAYAAYIPPIRSPGLGPAAALLTSRHHVDNTPVSGNSPYGLMRDYETYILMIGVGLKPATGRSICRRRRSTWISTSARSRVRGLYPCRDRHGTVHQVLARRHWRLDRDFNQFGPPLMAKGKLETGAIEGCPYTIVSQRDLLRQVFAALIDNPRGTLSIKAQQCQGSDLRL